MLNLLAELRPTYEHWPDGRCYRLWRIVRTVFPDAEAWYDPIVGHIYIKHNDRVYDIRGQHLMPPPLEPLARHHKAHRWEQ